MAVIGELATLITARTEPFTRGLKTAAVQAKTFTSKMQTTMSTGFGKINAVIGKTGTLLAGIGISVGGASLVKRAIDMAVAAEDMQTAFAVYLKDLNKAKQVMGELSKFSDATPFTPTDVQNAGKQLLAFGFTARTLMKDIYLIGTLAAGSQKPMADFVDILGKVKASGVASMGDVNRLADRGVPIFQALADVMGVASSEVRTLVGNSKVGFEQVYQALQNVTTGTGLFAGSLEKLSQTTGGKLSTLKGQIDALFRDVGTALLEGLDLKGLISALSDVVVAYKQDVINATIAGVQMLGDAMGALKAGKSQWDMAWALNDMVGAGIGRAWYGTVSKLAELNKSLGGGGMTQHARERLMYYNDKYYEAERRGVAAHSAASAQVPLSPGQRGYGQSDRHQQQTAEATQRTSVTLEQIWRQQEQENEMRRRAYQAQIDMYGGIVEVLY